MQEGPMWPWHAGDRAFQVMSLLSFLFVLDAWRAQSQGQMALALPLTCCVTLDQSLNLSDP